MTRFERITRTQDEILDRIVLIIEDDIFGYAREVLVERLDFDHVRPMLEPGATSEQWAEVFSTVPIAGVAEEYLQFAITQALRHRSVSASRSVMKLREIAWLAGLDDVMDAMDGIEFPQYGAPKLHAFAATSGLDDIWVAHGCAELSRMAVGRPCKDGCASGCDH